MITDNNLRLSGSLTAGAATFASGVPTGYPAGQEVLSTAVSTNTIDLSGSDSIAREIGSGKPLFFVWTVTTAFTRAAGALTVTFNIIIDNDAALGSPTVLASTGAIAKADLVIGAKFFLQIPPVAASLGLRYLGASYTLSASGDTGKVLCDVVEGIQDGMKFYPVGFSVA